MHTTLAYVVKTPQADAVAPEIRAPMREHRWSWARSVWSEVLSYVVSTRNREIAVRMALGAENREVRRMVVLQGARITVAGVVTGLLAAFFLTRVRESLPFGVGSLDVPTLAAMAGLMLAVALLASYVPVRRASSVDPMESLRAE